LNLGCSRDTINAAVLVGDGIGRPLGFLNPQAGIPICDVSPATQQFTLADLMMLKFEVPQQWQDGAVFLMNSRIAALLFTMSDAIGRPLLTFLLERAPGFMLAGSPIVLCSWMPKVEPGATPILFGNLKATYIDRRAVTMLTGPFSAG
jgi:HK97 family phage major capsid protein